jgi:hypothetical protein
VVLAEYEDTQNFQMSTFLRLLRGLFWPDKGCLSQKAAYRGNGIGGLILRHRSVQGRENFLKG